MGDETLDTNASIDELLKSRAQFQAWLAKLDGADDGAPLHVRAKVRSDYHGRLQKVLEQLRLHAGAVSEALTTQQATLATLEARDAEVAEQLAEAQLRHAVGEYSEEEWERIAADARAKRSRMADEIDLARKEIDRLTEVQAIILDAPAAPEPEPQPEPVTPPMLEMTPPEPVPAQPSVPPAAAMAASATAPSLAPAPQPAAAPLDELDFLKSVTGDEGAGRSRPAATVAAPKPAPAAAPSAAGATPKAKTLKCQECGTENKPTEWYCERCGAELTEL